MAMIALSDLFTPEGRDAVVSSLLATAKSIEMKVTAWQEGQPIRDVLVLVSQKISDQQALMAEAIKGGLLDYATKGWLTLLAQSLYRVTRLDARRAEDDSFVLTNASDQEHGPIAPGDLILAHSVTGKTYRNTEEITIPASGILEDVKILADEAGSASDAAPGLISVVVTSLSGVTCTHANAVLGRDEEEDEPLRERCRDKLGALSPNGPKEAYAYVAKTPELSAVSVAITRTQVIASAVTGFLTVYLATAAGAPSGPDVTIVDEAIDTWATPWCTTATASASAEVLVPVTYTVWIQGSSLTVLQIKSAIATALARYFATLPIGGFKIPPSEDGFVYQGKIEQVIGGATPGIFKVEVTLPAADVSVDDGEVAKLGTIIGTVEVIT